MGGFFLSMNIMRGIIVFCLLLLFTQPVHTETFTNPPKLVKQTDFGDGLFYEQYSHPLTGTFHLVRVKLSSMKWRVKPAINPACIMNAGSVKNLAQASNPNAACGINASFFDPGNFPVGTVAIDGKIVSLDNRRRSTLGIRSNGIGIISVLTPKAFITPDDYFEPIWIWGYNHPTRGDSIIAYNHNWGSSQVGIPSDGKGLVIENEKVAQIVDKGVVTIPREGFALIFRGKSRYHLERFRIGCNVTLGVTMPDEWEEVCDMVTGGPRLIDIP